MGACPKMITDPGYTLTLAPAATTLVVGDSTRLTATLRDKDGRVVPSAFSWSVDNASVAKVDSTGLVRGVEVGTTAVRATTRGETATATLSVSDNGRTLTVSPTATILSVDASQRFTATLKDRNGNTIPATPDWTSSNTSVATVDGTGLVRGVATGSATIQAKVGALVAAGAVTVGPRPDAVTFIGAGDIAVCTSGADEATADILDRFPAATVFTAGDNAYPNGALTDYQTCYAPSWGRAKARTRPVPGNHDYNTSGAAGYFSYFGTAAGDPGKGYYSYDLGGWHILALNSSLAVDSQSPQVKWIRADLADHPLLCTLAYFHHPRFSSGSQHGNDASMQAMWQALYDAGVDIVISGHDHIYERFAPQTPTGQLDLGRGIREFVVGTGGASLYTIGSIKANSEVRNITNRGVLKLALYADHYDWQFIPTSGSFTDTGSASCH
jgi:hypothetical protein